MGATSGAARANDTILVAAAASLTDAFGEIGRAFTRTSGGQVVVRFSFGASGALAQQIAQGAPVDVFASAGEKEITTLARSGRIEPATRAAFAGNRLALIASTRMFTEVDKPPSWYDLTTSYVRRVALGNPDTVPAGRYARQLLERKGYWPAVRAKVIFAENVRQALTYVASGDVDAGIVFVTDAKSAGRRVRVLATSLPGRDHDPIVYPAAVVAGSENAASARRFVAFLRGATAQAILRRYGFAAASAVPSSRR